MDEFPRVGAFGPSSPDPKKAARKIAARRDGSRGIGGLRIVPKGCFSNGGYLLESMRFGSIVQDCPFKLFFDIPREWQNFHAIERFSLCGYEFMK